jgi:hypothetical protein
VTTKHPGTRQNRRVLNLGLLLDVDGPIASPETRSIAIPSILDDLVALTAGGVPIAFITGRSDAFIREQVIEPLLAAGLADALAAPGARMFGVYEKGGTWSTISGAGLGELTVDESVALPTAFADDIRSLVESDFADSMFFDATKHAMVSVEQRADYPAADYKAEQRRFDEAAWAVAERHGLGITWGDRRREDAAGETPFRFDDTIISTDIENRLLDKDRGARRALEHFRGHGELPTVWRSVGDSRSDYLMADALHADGFEVAHVDVRPSDGVLDKPYRVLVEPDGIHDVAGAAFLRHWAAQL